MKRKLSICQKVCLFFVLVYQKMFSFFLPAKCRFVPTCSTFALEAIKKFGAVKGSFLALKRICRCNPFVKSGFDPVPENLRGDFKWLQ